MSKINVGSLNGTKVITDTTGSSAKNTSGDKKNTNSSAVSKIAVPKGSQNYTGPTG